MFEAERDTAMQEHVKQQGDGGVFLAGWDAHMEGRPTLGRGCSPLAWSVAAWSWAAGAAAAGKLQPRHYGPDPDPDPEPAPVAPSRPRMRIRIFRKTAGQGT